MGTEPFTGETIPYRAALLPTTPHTSLQLLPCYWLLTYCNTETTHKVGWLAGHRKTRCGLKARVHLLCRIENALSTDGATPSRMPSCSALSVFGTLPSFANMRPFKPVSNRELPCNSAKRTVTFMDDNIKSQCHQEDQEQCYRQVRDRGSSVEERYMCSLK